MGLTRITAETGEKAERRTAEPFNVQLTVTVCAVVSVPRLHDHSVRSLKQREREVRGQHVLPRSLTYSHRIHSLRYESLIKTHTRPAVTD